MSGQTDAALGVAKWVGNGIASLFGKAVRNPGKATVLGVTGDVALNDADGIKGATMWGIKQAAEKVFGIDPDSINPDYALPIAAAAGAGLLGTMLGGGNVGLLSTAATLIGFTLKHLTGSETAPAQVASVTGPEQSI